jgi:uncharacterized protein
VATVVVGMAVQASVGFGFGFFVAPAALAAYRPAQAVTLLLLLALLINSLILWSEGREREIDGRATALLCAWALPGIVGGALVVRHLDAKVLQVAIGVGIILAAALQTRTMSNARAATATAKGSDATLAAGGMCAGALTSATSLNGPAVVLTYTRAGLRGHMLRDTGAAAFIVLALAGTAALAALAHAGRSLPSWPLLVALVPAVFIGHRLGAAMFHRLDAERHTRLVLAAAIVTGTVSVVAGLV